MSSVPILVGHSASLSDVGTVRSVNEDSYLELPVSEGGLWVVADGMGGHEAGDVARVCSKAEGVLLAPRLRHATAAAVAPRALPPPPPQPQPPPRRGAVCRGK